ncbi:cobalamin-independent methionine synthase II family protein [Eggerthellaceae bacterium zg-1084]|nr:cobalamin-independent methionine synthase II family protein [Berryella wangjianweii]
MNRGLAMERFFTSLMGSMPRSAELMRARRLVSAGRMEQAAYDELVERQTAEVIAFQESLGLDVIVSGELGRDNYVSFISDKLGGVTQMSMAEMMDYIEDKQAFDEMLDILDVPAVSIRNAICTGPLAYREGIALDELRMMKRCTTRPVKVTLPGPYLVTRSMWLPGVSTRGYATKEDLGEAVLDVYRQEVEALQAAGADIIQFDEPVLTEVVFTEGKTRTFMCAALSQRKDPTEELEFAGHLIERAVGFVDPARSMSCVHVCRGNWSRNEEILLTGPYTPLIDLFARARPQMLALEFSTPRAGELSAFLADQRIQGRFALGLGVMNPRADETEPVEGMVAAGRMAAEALGAGRVALNPDCGFATFSSRPVNAYPAIERKVGNMVRAAALLREEFCG